MLIAGGLAAARWGWVRDFATGGRIINARWETATEKRTFAEAVERRRCVIPATAYYEWRRDERDRPLEKYAFLPASGGWLAMAGLYEDVPLHEGSERRFLVLTRPMASTLASMTARPSCCQRLPRKHGWTPRRLWVTCWMQHDRWGTKI